MGSRVGASNGNMVYVSKYVKEGLDGCMDHVELVQVLG